MFISAVPDALRRAVLEHTGDHSKLIRRGAVLGKAATRAQSPGPARPGPRAAQPGPGHMQAHDERKNSSQSPTAVPDCVPFDRFLSSVCSTFRIPNTSNIDNRICIWAFCRRLVEGSFGGAGAMFQSTMRKIGHVRGRSFFTCVAYCHLGHCKRGMLCFLMCA